MKRIKRHKVKIEAPETSTSHHREQEIHDLAYYIHDRVELMHQVFSVLKYKELKAMVPASIRNISLDDLQELCTEELLGISSKRLCAILDGAEPPSDTESSSPSPPPEQMETISLDSISSDDEILSQASSKKKKHKHRRHAKTKSRRKKSTDKDYGEADRSKASRAGLTVLELLELQARARAIRAQLQQEHKPVSQTTTLEPSHSSDNEVEIKEEPAEVVEISSDDEKPKVEDLQMKIRDVHEETPAQEATPHTTVTKRINELVITVPQKTKQKIKLNRNKSVIAATETSSTATAEKPKDTSSVATTEKTKVTANVATNKIAVKKIDDSKNSKSKPKKKKKDKKSVSKDDIDNDEITLQLSDTEKMDLLEDLDRKNYDSVSSESSSESSSDSDVSDKEKGKDDVKGKNSDGAIEKVAKNEVKLALEAEEVVIETDKVASETEKESDGDKEDAPEKVSSEVATVDNTKKTDSNSSYVANTEDNAEKIESDDTVQNNANIETNAQTESNDSNNFNLIKTTDSNVTLKDTVTENLDEIIKDTPTVVTKGKETEEAKDSDKNMSEGELSDRESSEVEAVDLKPEVVCISDDEGGKKAKKKKKKKDKKSKKEKKSKKKSDFRESADQNFYKENFKIGDLSQEEILSQVPIEVIDNQLETPSKDSPTINKVLTEIIDKVDLTAEKTIDEDIKPIKDELVIDKDVNTVSENPEALSDSDVEAVYEIMELSDDSSCCEVECTMLSKEPTASEIEALSAKIDEIERVEIITDKEIIEYEKKREDLEEIEKISWKDRYLDSRKVRKVLTTANIFNALRRKNIELKKKLAESKMETEETVAEEKEVQEENVLEEGSIEQFNTLEALTTYVDPVKELPKDLKKDAKLLLKMYKKLLKYNDMTKPDHEKKRKKKKKKIKKDTVNTEVGEDRGSSDTMEKNTEVRLEVGEKSA